MQLLEYRFRAMGSPCQFKLYHPSSSHLENVKKILVSEVEHLENKYSRFKKDSLTSIINQQAGSKQSIKLDQETAALMDYAQVAYQQSDGLFDITTGPLTELWDFKKAIVPSQQRLNETLQKVGLDKVIWNNPHLQLPLKEMKIDFGGLVKEYAVDSLVSLSKQHHLQNGLIDLGGDIGIIGPIPNDQAWSIGIQHPRQDGAMATIALNHGCLASSGDYQRFFHYQGVRYSHLINPTTGYPIKNNLLSVSVLSEQCIIAGTAATIALLKKEKDAYQWLDELGLANLRINQELRISGNIKKITK